MKVPSAPPVIIIAAIFARWVSAKVSASSGIPTINSAPVPSPAINR